MTKKLDSIIDIILLSRCYIPSFSLITETILRQYVKADLVDEFMRARAQLKQAPKSRVVIVAYKLIKTKIRPHIAAAKQKLEERITQLERSNIATTGFIRASAIESPAMINYKNDVTTLSSYLYI